MANTTLWAEIENHQYTTVTRSVVPQNTFTHGGNRYPNTLGVKQQALIKYVETQALAAPPMDDDDTVAGRCVDDVDRRWHTSDANVITIVWRIVRTVTQ